ncbi:gluconate 2-dehydrogenase subunit 3 family protein [Fulvivirga sedimenti]|uniref:Gluconate 2-dehydrogenase subunit 3 family protein n=1 Tax=Fulvivirga sedimenti TaxID=2879465 RepID=A0A9X1HWB1_9BACT|nr:gluconate 2-dehydrogenase subunit 3 family protein [Fulvivirga sedimenti]MCA6078836.1 gluconate 2-dehydrogenase subunit 3 family protein [Fulvivirga sedimenti]
MDRRKAIRNVLLGSAGMTALPSWANGWSANGITISHWLTADNEETLRAVADTLIPPGNAIGALDVGVDRFMMKLFAECYETDIQNGIEGLLSTIDKSAITIHGTGFATCGQEQRQQLIEAIAVSENESVRDSYDLFKRECIRGFRTSKEVMTQYLNYKVAPGHYIGCVDVKETNESGDN